MGDGETSRRKDEHLDIVLNKNVEFDVLTTGFECVNIITKSLPEVDLSEVNTVTEFMDKKISAPILISALTGGTKRTKEINLQLAKTAEQLRIPICLGSQRAMLEDKSKTETFRIVKENAGSVPVVGNFGIVQLKHYGPEPLLDAVERVGADGLAIHINPEQEVVQYEGDTEFSGCLAALKDLIKHSGSIKIMVKQVGHGIDRDTADTLLRIGGDYLVVAGSGGTSCTKVESLRSKARFHVFNELGIPTVVSILMACLLYTSPSPRD